MTRIEIPSTDWATLQKQEFNEKNLSLCLGVHVCRIPFSPGSEKQEGKISETTWNNEPHGVFAAFFVDTSSDFLLVVEGDRCKLFLSGAALSPVDCRNIYHHQPTATATATTTCSQLTLHFIQCWVSLRPHKKRY
jgi:hypothetical protein